MDVDGLVKLISNNMEEKEPCPITFSTSKRKQIVRRFNHKDNRRVLYDTLITQARKLKLYIYLNNLYYILKENIFIYYSVYWLCLYFQAIASKDVKTVLFFIFQDDTLCTNQVFKFLRYCDKDNIEVFSHWYFKKKGTVLSFGYLI